MIDLSAVEAEKSPSTDWLPNEIISFNPSSEEDVRNILGTYGPEGLFEIAKKLHDVAMDDITPSWDYRGN